MKSTAIVIPARLDSKRLPGKILLKWKNKEILRHILETAEKLATRSVDVWVATNDEHIKKMVESWGGNVFTSSGMMRNGTERVQDFAKVHKRDYYINVQGDDPTLTTAVLEATVYEIKRERFHVVTPHYRIDSAKILQDPNKVKLVKDSSDKVLYFSRSLIPYQVIQSEALSGSDINSDIYLGHIGVYAYNYAALQSYVIFPASKLEIIENLEQLRFLENSIDIGTFEVKFMPKSVDCLEDLENLERR